MLAAIRSILLSFSLILAGYVSLGICQDSGSVATLSTVESHLDLSDTEEDEFAEPYEMDRSVITDPAPAQFRSNFTLKIASANNFIAQLDSQLGRINEVFSYILLYDFGTSRLKQFGAADIQRQSEDRRHRRCERHGHNRGCSAGRRRGSARAGSAETEATDHRQGRVLQDTAQRAMPMWQRQEIQDVPRRHSVSRNA